MDISAAAEALMRRRLLEGIYDRMTDEERRLFVRMAMEERTADDIKQALARQSAQLDRLQRTQQTFAADFASNVAGNAVWDGVTWIFSRLARLLR